MLTLGATIGTLGARWGLDAVRACVLTRASIRLDRLLAGRIMTTIIEGAQTHAPAPRSLRRGVHLAPVKLGRDSVGAHVVSIPFPQTQLATAQSAHRCT
jgi:hypothetical protein